MFFSGELSSFRTALRVVDLPLPVGPVTRQEPELIQGISGALLKEDPHDHLFAVDRRQGGDAEIDLLPVHRELDPAVLREPLLGDVHPAHDLDPGDDGGEGGLGRGHHIALSAVEPEANADVALGGLDVDVAATELDRLGDEGVDELNDGDVVGLGLFRALDLLTLFLLDLDALKDLLGLNAVVLVEGLVDLGFRGDGRDDLDVQSQLEVVQGEDIRRIGHGQEEAVPLAMDGDAPVLAGQVLGDQFHQLRIELVLGQ